jgi:CRP-like cAMP-binding protein
MSNNEHAIVNTWNTPEFRADLAFPKLTDEMVERLRPYGREETFPANALLFTHGERQVDMFVVLDGEVEVALQAENGVSKVIARHSTYYFTGELNMLNSQGSLVEGRTVSPSRLLRIPRNELQRLMRAEGEIANLFTSALIWRRIGIMAGTERRSGNHGAAALPGAQHVSAPHRRGAGRGSRTARSRSVRSRTHTARSRALGRPHSASAYDRAAGRRARHY